MNNLPYEVLQNIIHYAGKSAKYINSRFYEIVLDCKWNYKLIDLSTITIEELIKNSNVKYIKVIVTKDRSKKELIEVIKYLFDINKFELKGVYIKVPACFKSNDEVEFFRQIVNDNNGPAYFYYLKDSIVLQLKIGILNQIFLNNLIFDLSEHTDSFDEFNKNELKLLRDFWKCFDFYFINNIRLHYEDFSNVFKFTKINNFIYKNFPAHYKNCKKEFVVYNGKDMFINYRYTIFFDGSPYENMNVFDESPYKNMNVFESRGSNKWFHKNKQNINTPTLQLSYKEMLKRTFGTNIFNKILKLK